MNNAKKGLSLALTGTLALSMGAPAFALPPAVPEKPWYAEAQTYVTEKGLMKGTDNGFEPTAPVNRATVFQTLYNMAGRPAVEKKAAFKDVTGDAWYADSAAWAFEQGLVRGDDQGNYAGDRTVTRQETATILYRYEQSLGGGFKGMWMFLLDFEDRGTIAEWADEGVHWCVSSQIMTGKPGRLFAPADTLSRAELAQILMNAEGKLAAPVEPEKPEKPEAGVQAVTGKVTEVEKYGHAVLDVTIDDFHALGYELGDIVTVTAGDFYADMPYLDGYYVDKGEYMLRAYPGKENIAVCINYGKFNEKAGVEVGSELTISMKEEDGAAALQATYSLKYTNERADYASDEVFANFRPVVLGDIAEGHLYRSASPVNNEYGRAAAADALIRTAGVKTVMNLADTDEEIAEYLAAEDFKSPYYKGLLDSKAVIALGMPINYSSDEFAEGIVRGLTFLAKGEAPYLVHCTEGKDRAGFTSALLEALMGASVEEIVADYMVSYENYYHLTQDDAKYELIAGGNVMDMLRTIAGLEKNADLTGVDMARAAETYLTAHGMAAGDLNTLKANLKG